MLQVNLPGGRQPELPAQLTFVLDQVATRLAAGIRPPADTAVLIDGIWVHVAPPAVVQHHGCRRCIVVTFAASADGCGMQYRLHLEYHARGWATWILHVVELAVDNTAWPVVPKAPAGWLRGNPVLRVLRTPVFLAWVLVGFPPVGTAVLVAGFLIAVIAVHFLGWRWRDSWWVRPLGRPHL